MGVAIGTTVTRQGNVLAPPLQCLVALNIECSIFGYGASYAAARATPLSGLGLGRRFVVTSLVFKWTLTCRYGRAVMADVTDYLAS